MSLNSILTKTDLPPNLQHNLSESESIYKNSFPFTTLNSVLKFVRMNKRKMHLFRFWTPTRNFAGTKIIKSFCLLYNVIAV